MPRSRTLVLGATVAFAASAPAQLPWLTALPDAAVAVVQCEDPPAAWAALHTAFGAVPADLPDVLLGGVGLGLAVVRATLGGDVAAFVDRMARHGAALAFEPGVDGGAFTIVLRPGDPAAARAWCREHAATWRLEGQDVLVLRRGSTGAAGQGAWANADFGPSAAVRAVIDLERVRALGTVPTVASLDGGGRVLLGPLVHALEHGTCLRMALHGGDALRLSVAVDASVRGAPLGGLLPAAGSRRELPLPDDGLATLRLDRSLTALLRTPEAWLPADAVLGVRAFLSIADALDGPRRSFVEHLLGGLVEPWRVHVLPPDPEALATALPLPGFAVVAAVRDDAAVASAFATAQALLTIANVERQQRGRVPFLPRWVHGEHGRGLCAEPGSWRGPGPAPIELGYTPTLWHADGWLVLASSPDAVRRVLAGAARLVDAGGDRLVLRGAAVAAWLRTHREVVELTRRLDEGVDAAAARRFADAVLAVAAAVHELALAVEVGAEHTTLTLQLERAR